MPPGDARYHRLRKRPRSGGTFLISTVVRSELAAFALALILLRLAPLVVAANLFPRGVELPWPHLAATAAATALAAWITRRARLA